jgi:membrane-associated phospholipid phosphatase
VIVRQTIGYVIGAILGIGITPALVNAQALQTSALESPATPVSVSDDSAKSEPGLVTGFLRDVGGDYKNFLSVETAWWLGGGGGAAWAVHAADQSIADSAQANPPSLPGGSLYGSQLVQIPVAVGWWIAGSAAGSPAQAAVGRDLLRAELSVASWTYAIKFAVDRTRPNGDPRGFPSGHASTSFAIATVLQEHFGWKAGIPAFAAAAYTGVERVADNQHWASDVVFGAALGVASGRTVTIRLRHTRVSAAPAVMPGGLGVTFTAVR